jgi:hypothetical protein
MDEYFSRSLKNWAARRPVPQHLRTRILARASNVFISNSRSVEELLQPRSFGRPILDGNFGLLVLNNMYLFNTSIISIRMII